MKKSKLFLFMILTVFIIPLSGCILMSNDSVTIGSRNNTESIILSHVMGTLIQDKTDVKVTYRENLGGSNVVWNAMLNDSLDIVPDYTGTIVLTYYHEEPGNADETLEQTKRLVAQDNIVALNTFGFNNTYTLALDETTAEENDIVTFSDFSAFADQYILGAVFEFIDRPDGLPGFVEQYDIEFKDVKGMDHGMMYRAIDSNEVDVINSYTTDGQLQTHDLRVLEDDESFFPPYHALPLIRKEVLEENPELEEILLLLEGEIDEEKMQAMNGRVDNDGELVEIVARDFLKDAGLID